MFRRLMEWFGWRNVPRLADPAPLPGEPQPPDDLEQWRSDYLTCGDMEAQFGPAGLTPDGPDGEWWCG